jgi:hypothetical protein
MVADDDNLQPSAHGQNLCFNSNLTEKMRPQIQYTPLFLSFIIGVFFILRPNENIAKY